MEIVIFIIGIITCTAIMLLIINVIYHWGYGDLKFWIKKLFKDIKKLIN